MSKSRNSTKKVSLSELNNHTISNKRQAMKDLKMLDFNELQFKNTAQKRFYKTGLTIDQSLLKLCRLNIVVHYQR